MKVFLSYGGTADQVTTLRLQALAAVNGLSVFVPPALTRQSPALVVESEVARRLGDSDVVLAVIASALTRGALKLPRGYRIEYGGQPGPHSRSSCSVPLWLLGIRLVLSTAFLIVPP